MRYNKQILRAIRDERFRQQSLFMAGKIGFDCADPNVSDTDKLPVLLEELGEVGEELQILAPILKCPESKTSKADLKYRLRTELIQVAAVACAWAESLYYKEP